MTGQLQLIIFNIINLLLLKLFIANKTKDLSNSHKIKKHIFFEEGKLNNEIRPEMNMIILTVFEIFALTLNILKV